MKTLFISGDELVLRGCFPDGVERECYVQLRVVTDGEKLIVGVTPAPVLGEVYDFGIEVPFSYNGDEKVISSGCFNGEAVVEFPYSDFVREAAFGCEAKYRGGDFVKNLLLKWKGGYDDPDPALDLRCSGVRAGEGGVIYWDAYAPEGYIVKLISVMVRMYRRGIDGDFRREVILSGKRDGHGSYQHRVECSAGDTFEYRALAAIYVSAGAGIDEYVGIAEAGTSILPVQEANALFPPLKFKYRLPTAGSALKLSWEAAEETLDVRGVIFELERSLDRGEFELIYSGSSVSFTDVPGRGWENVTYRVRAVPVGAAGVKASVWVIGEESVVGQSNVYIGTSSGIKPAAGVFIGNSAAGAIFYVGGV